jgi:alpha-L-fucosidase
VAELEAATRRQGLRFGVSSHRAFNWRYYTYDDDYDTVDPACSGLYNRPHAEDEPATPQWIEDWFARTKELIDKYRPDVLWFDFGWHREEFEPYRPKVAAYYYNRGLEWGKGVVLQYKDKLPDGVAVYDVERGKLDDIREHYWQTDTSVSYKSWCYIEDDEFRSVASIVHDLVDIVSKNGNLLLNVGPRPDGMIPEEPTNLLRGLGDWLEVNGEAIYGTRHWQVYGEGETGIPKGFKEREQQPYTARDIRFTTKGNALYAICLDWPGQEATIKSLGSGSSVRADGIAEVTMLGSDEPLAWSQDEAGLTIKAPAERPCDHAYALKIVLRESE